MEEVPLFVKAAGGPKRAKTFQFHYYQILV